MRLTVYVDSTSVEVFAGQGEVALTDLVFPSPASTGVALVAGDPAYVRLLEVSDLTPD